jgi:cytochrome oxidase Cu insertion factor (SCO1/SenC/PrrC family)
MRVNPSALSAIVAILGYTAVVFFAFAIGLTNEHSAALTNEHSAALTNEHSAALTDEQGMRVHVVAIKGIHGDL